MKLFDHLDESVPLGDDERLLFDAVRAMCRDKIAPRAAGHDRNGDFPWDNVADINALGLNAMFLAQIYGGADLSYTAYLACVREISKACASTGVIWSTNFHAMNPVAEFGPAALQKRILPKVATGALASLCITEPNAGSDATGMTTKFTPDGDHIVVDGGKIFITNGGIADYYLVFGKWSEIDDPKASISALVLEKNMAGFSAGKPEDKMGMRASMTTPLNFDKCRVPRGNLLGAPGDGLRILLASLNKSRPSVAAHALGIARAAFEDAVHYINQRRQSGQPIIQFQGIQFLLADMAAELALCENWLWHVGRLVDSGAADFGVEASLLKMRAGDVAMRITIDAVQLFGGYGYIKENRVERLMRDAKICQIWEGTKQVHQQFIGRSFIER